MKLVKMSVFNTINPTLKHQLDVDGTIRANVYENFKLSDLPDATEETIMQEIE